MTEHYEKYYVDSPKAFALRLEQLRKKKDWNKTDAAKNIGLSPGAYSNYEYGYRKPSEFNLKRIAKTFNVSPLYLKTGITINDYHYIQHKMLKDITTAHLAIDSFQANNEIGQDTGKLLNLLISRLFSLQHLVIKTGEINYELQEKLIKKV